MLSNSYKRPTNDRQWLQEVCKHIGFSFKYVEEGNCNIMIAITRW
jgi:hypothetical protein